MTSVLKRMIDNDNDDIDLVTQRFGIIVTCIVDTGEGYAIMSHKLDPEGSTFESIEEGDDVSKILLIAHNSQEKIWGSIVDKVNGVDAMRKLLDLLISK
jgi:hypothetical protein